MESTLTSPRPREIPRDPALDATWSMLHRPYDFIGDKCRRLETDLFRTRIVLQPAICMRGRDAAALLYDESRFTRQGAMPGWSKSVLFGQGGVQGLDDESHKHRKQMFLNVITPERVDELTREIAHGFSEFARQWASMPRVVLYDEAKEIVLRATCRWAGIPLKESLVGRRCREISLLYEGAMSIGLKRLRAGWARQTLNRWGVDVIARIRQGGWAPPHQSGAWIIAHHRDLQRELLPPEVAAVELLSLLRPTVAIAVWIVFAALALDEFPESRAFLSAGGEPAAEAFAQEVRRYYPFFPLIMARVRRDFRWHGYEFPQGERVVLDVYGTNRDQRQWDAPDQFRPQRFLDREIDPFSFIPQGGGDRAQHHRCPGEPIAVEAIKAAARFLTTQITYTVPDQDLKPQRSRVPALPASGFVMQNVQRG